MKKKIWALLTAGLLAAGTISMCYAYEAAARDMNTDISETEGISESAETETEEDLSATPWMNTSILGNVPEEKPSEKDDFYSNDNYEWLQSFMESDISEFVDETYIDFSGSAMREAVVGLIEDDRVQSELLEKIRLMYRQAQDVETLDALGLEPVQPYLNMIDSAENLEELGAVLSDEAFPFTPFINPLIDTQGTDAKSVITIWPNFVFADNFDGAYDYRSDVSDLKDEGEAILAYYWDVENALCWLEEGEESLGKLLEWESSFGKDCPYMDLSNTWEYGTIGEHIEALSLEELQEMCGDYPIASVLRKNGVDKSRAYYTMEKNWLRSFAACYTEENLEILKLAAKVSILIETKNVLTPNTPYIQSFGEEYGPEWLYGDNVPYQAVSSLDTFKVAIIELYVNEILGETCKERLEKLCVDLKDTYLELIEQNTWLEEETKAAIYEKLDRMEFNTLLPNAGFYDYDTLHLKSSREGGTLFENYLILKKYNIEKRAELLEKQGTGISIWFMVDPLVGNAFYSPESNSFHILPGLIQEKLFSDDMSDEELLGGMGFFIAHEMSHAFDYTSSQFDAYGNLNVWFSGNDLEEFLARQEKLKDYIDTIMILPGKYANGGYVISEAGADLTALTVITKLAQKSGYDLETVYRAFAKPLAEVISREWIEYLADWNPHPLAYYRMNLPLQMMDEFYEIFDVKEGDGMYLPEEERVQIW